MGFGQSKGNAKSQHSVETVNGPVDITGFSNTQTTLDSELLKRYLVFSSGGKISWEHPPRSELQLVDEEGIHPGNAYQINKLKKMLVEWEDECEQSVAADVYANQVSFSAERVFCKLPSGAPLTLPLNQASIDGLLEATSPAALGIEGKGDVVDPSLRLTKEISAEKLQELDDLFKNFEFPTAEAALHNHLCPSAERISIQPYKLLIYQPGDFFSLHVDTMHHPDQFGSLALEIPIIQECLEMHDEAYPEATEGSVEQSRRGGELVFYAGSVQSDVIKREEHDKIEFLRADGVGWGHYGKPSKDRERMMQRLRLTTDPKEQTAHTLTAQFGAWLGDIPHEVRRLNTGYRVTLIYNLIKVGSKPMKVVRRKELLEKTDKILQKLKDNAFVTPLPDPTDFDEDPEDGKKILELRHAGPRRLHSLGVVLRHPYTRGGFSASNLKGIDAVLYHALSFHYQCYFLMATECRNDYPCAPFRRTSEDEGGCGCMKQVFIGSTLDEAGVDPFDEDSDIQMFVKNPVIGGCVWASLGQGTLLGGGHSYGNADCGADWWYRNCVMVISGEPTPWQRGRKSAMLLGLRGPDTFQRLYGVRDVFEHMLKWI